MNNTGTNQQLTLLSPASVPARFQLSERTRRRGKAHIAQIRAEMAQRRALEDAAIAQLPTRQPIRVDAA